MSVKGSAFLTPHLYFELSKPCALDLWTGHKRAREALYEGNHFASSYGLLRSSPALLL